MSRTIEKLTEGWTGNLDFTLYADGAPIDGTGMTPTLILRDRVGGAVNMTGKVNWLVAASGSVRVQLATEDLKAERSPYSARFKVTDGSGKVVYFPNGESDEWQVSPV